MNFFRSFVVLAFVAVALSSCGGMKESLGLGRSPPDEFAVIDRPPLAMPPDFGLRPPEPGAPRPQAVDPSINASDTLFGVSEAPAAGHSASLSSGEQALLAQTGADKAQPDIRATINSESMSVVETSPHLIDELLWWKKDKPGGAVVDAAAEAERLKAAKAKGEAPNATPTPIIEKDKSGWLGL